MFIDEARIVVKAGSGGHGMIAFRREKFVPKGGPSGGDGGNGGSVYLVSDPHINTLLKFRYNPLFKADRGRHGGGANKKGRDGVDCVVQVPVGTVVWDSATGALVHDFEAAGEKVLVAQGGRGGHGNAHFASSTNRAPQRAQDGQPGEEKTLYFELKLLADVGLVGYPNAGKSTLISRISAARPKVADYPFTTLQPHLGVVSLDEDRTFVVADIPGLIDGAHLGHGLGIQFLRHIERTRLLLHLIDVSVGNPDDPVKQFNSIRHELQSHSPHLVEKPSIVLATKIDAVDRAKLEKLTEFCSSRQLPLLCISSVSGDGLDILKQRVYAALSEERAAAGTP